MLTPSPFRTGAHVALDIRGLSVRHNGEARPSFRGLDLEVRPGTAVAVTGRSGCGKSTLIHTVAGLIPWLRPAQVEGEVLAAGDSVLDLDPGQRARLVGTCLDRPDGQLFLSTVLQEITAACRLHGRVDRIQGLAENFGIAKLVDRRITELSSGQRQRVALACALAASPRPVLLDEPTAHLDGTGVAALRSAMTESVDGGGSFLVTDQAGWRLAGAIGQWHRLDGGKLGAGDEPEAPTFPKPAPPGDRIALTCRSLDVARGGRDLLAGVELDLRAGEVVLLSGANGSGKSTFARVLAGFRRPSHGRVSGGRGVALMLPSAELQLFAGTVAAEVASAGAGRSEISRVLRRHRLEHLAARTPWTLSRGERQRLVHAALDLLRPAVMIVDEPAQGLDAEDLADFVDLVHRRAEKGRAYLIISHRAELAGCVHRHLEVRDGSLVEVTS